MQNNPIEVTAGEMKLTVEGHGDDGGVALYHEGAFVAELESAEDAESAAAEYSEFFA